MFTGTFGLKNLRNSDPTYMGDSTKPLQKFAGTGENSNIAIAVIFYLGIKLYENFCASKLVM